MFTFKPTNWPCCVDASFSKDDPRGSMIYNAFERGSQLRLDQPGISIARNQNVVPINYIAIERRREARV